MTWQHQLAIHKRKAPSTRPTPDEVVKRSCTDKKRYATEIMAIMKAKALIFRARHGKVLWTYACAHCGGWHLTKRLSDGTRVEG